MAGEGFQDRLPVFRRQSGSPPHGSFVARQQFVKGRGMHPAPAQQVIPHIGQSPPCDVHFFRGATRSGELHQDGRAFHHDAQRVRQITRLAACDGSARRAEEQHRSQDDRDRQRTGPVPCQGGFRPTLFGQRLTQRHLGSEPLALGKLRLRQAPHLHGCRQQRFELPRRFRVTREAGFDALTGSQSCQAIINNPTQVHLTAPQPVPARSGWRRPCQGDG